MRDEKPGGDLRELAEQVIAEKREEVGSEEQARELYDVPSEMPSDLEIEQRDDR